MIETIETKRRGKLISKRQELNPYTGELKEFILIGEPEEFDKNFTKIFHAFTEALINNEKIAGKAIRLLFWILKEIEYGRIEFYMNYKAVKENLNISRDTYHRWTRALIEEGIIKKINTNLYQLNPACVVKGKGHTLLEEFKKSNN